MRARVVLLVMLSAAFVACQSQNGAAGTRTGVSGGVAGSSQQPAALQLSTLGQLLDSLRMVPGRFELLPENRWSFVGPSEVFAGFVPFGDSAVVRLVDCLVDPGAGVATVEGRRVPIGVMCSWALRGVASFEWGAEDEVNGTWPGVVEPTATRGQLEAAAAAWRLVVEQHRYRLN